MSTQTETDKTRFFYQLRQYGFSRLILSADFLIAGAVFIVMLIDKRYGFGIFLSADGAYVVAVFAAASTLFSITLATLAIILSFSNSELMQFLREKNKLESMLFPFWLGNITYLFVIVLAVIYLTVDITKINILQNYLYPTITALFLYGLLNTFYLLGTVIRFGYFIDVFNKRNG